VRVSTALAGLAIAAALVAAAFLIFADTYSGQTCVASASGSSTCTSESSSLIEENGSWVLILLAVPVLLSLLGFVAVQPHLGLPWFLGWTIAVGYAILCVAAMFSIGFFFIPSAALLLVATALNGYRRAYPPMDPLEDRTKDTSLRPE
jgi:hypothetical protein